ncbi:hypothetical protein MARHY1876 [Marinobacter nauticus ATCC 49840]|nr:hypothetical protein MARHY1876 [Marinobacter nauticus ATCC 49840]
MRLGCVMRIGVSPRTASYPKRQPFVAKRSSFQRMIKTVAVLVACARFTEFVRRQMVSDLSLTSHTTLQVSRLPGILAGCGPRSS